MLVNYTYLLKWKIFGQQRTISVQKNIILFSFSIILPNGAGNSRSYGNVAVLLES